MTGLFPEIESDDHGMLSVSDGNLVYWETSGNPNGNPAVVLHGGPGSGRWVWQRRLFDPDAYRVVRLASTTSRTAETALRLSGVNSSRYLSTVSACCRTPGRI